MTLPVASEPTRLWRAWERKYGTYVSPGPDSKIFRSVATYNGDPFTVFYLNQFLDLGSLGCDIDGVDWFSEAETAYRAHVEFFKEERGFLDSLSFGGVAGAIALPKSNPSPPLIQEEATVFTVAGGLNYYYCEPVEKHPLALALSLLAATPGFFDWHGWMVHSVKATDPKHPVANNYIIGQHIAQTGISVDSFLEDGRLQKLSLGDNRLREVLQVLFPQAFQPLQSSQIQKTELHVGNLALTIVAAPGTYAVEVSSDLSRWNEVDCLRIVGGTTWRYPLDFSATSRFFRIRQRETSSSR